MWLLLCDPDKLTARDLAYRAAICRVCPPIETARQLIMQFCHLMRTHDAGGLTSWVAEAKRSRLSAFAGFVAGLHRDWSAVWLGFTTPWSQGQTEGFVNKLKVQKRRYYGRASFSLLRQSILAAG